MRSLSYRAIGLAVVVFAVLPAGAAAHVTVEPAQAPAGAFQAYAIRVPTEKNVPTTRVRVEFPGEVVVSRFLPKAGWTREVEKDQTGRTVAATWSGGSVAADEYEEFGVLMRNPRQPGKIAFKAYQTYGDGSVVEWVGPEGAEEPAAVVVITASAATSSETSIESPGEQAGPGPRTVPATPAGGATVGSGAPAPGERPRAADAGSDLSLFVAITALVVSAIALGLAVVTLARRPRAA